MKLPLGIASKLQSMIETGTELPASSLQHTVVKKMIDNGVLQKIHSGRLQARLMVKDPRALHAYIFNEFGISDIGQYIHTISTEHSSRSEAVIASGNSKLRTVRTFKGFLVNCFSEVAATLHNEPYILHPSAGSFTFIYDYEFFIPASDITVVYIENPENFRYIDRQRTLFTEMKPLFVSRYPHSHDLLKWLRDIISNEFVYYGDLDFGGINIYLNEYKKHLGSRASFLIPGNVEDLIQRYGNTELYNRQLEFAPGTSQMEAHINSLIQLFHQYKRVLEQEVFIGRR